MLGRNLDDAGELEVCGMWHIESKRQENSRILQEVLKDTMIVVPVFV